MVYKTLKRKGTFSIGSIFNKRPKKETIPKYSPKNPF